MDEVAFGRYRLIEMIGEGAMGKVYRAHDTKMRRDVAIKVLAPELATEPGYRERFQREAYTAARLTEPHIVPIYEADEIDDRLYLVMPVVDGIDVGSLLSRDGTISPRLAVKVIEQVAAALDAAHKHGLVHRDVKPSNALMTADEFVYLIDFGIAHNRATDTKLTRTGSIIGTWGYMAPERFGPGSTDARADVYALACVLYECLTGKLPFPGDSLEQQISGHLTKDPPRPTAINRAVPAGFDQVIARGMAKEPDKRYQTARELATAARQALTVAPAAAPRDAAPTLVDGTATRPSAAPGPVLPATPRPMSASRPRRHRGRPDNHNRDRRRSGHRPGPRLGPPSAVTPSRPHRRGGPPSNHHHGRLLPSPRLGHLAAVLASRPRRRRERPNSSHLDRHRIPSGA